MAAKLTILTHKIAIQLHLVAESCTICSSRSRRPVRKRLVTTSSRTALGPTQPPIRWEPEALSLEVKRPGREADHSPPSSVEVKEWVELYLHSPNTPPWRDAQLKHRNDFTSYAIPVYVFIGGLASASTVHSSQLILWFHKCFYSLVNNLVSFTHFVLYVRCLRFSRQWGQVSWFCGLLRRVVWWLDTIVSEDRASSIFRVLHTRRVSNPERQEFCIVRVLKKLIKLFHHHYRRRLSRIRPFGLFRSRMFL
jgi:hypothetical protein